MIGSAEGIEPRIGAYALGPVVVVHVGLGAVGAFHSVDEAVARRMGDELA